MNVKVRQAESRRASQSDPSELLRMCMSAFKLWGFPDLFRRRRVAGVSGATSVWLQEFNLIQGILASKFSALGT